jgi:hypothetical protein
MILTSRKPIHFDHPATYRIVVQGQIDPSLSERLEGMTISIAWLDLNSPITTLEGTLSDQAALAGVLNTLYELHLLVLTVDCLNFS